MVVTPPSGVAFLLGLTVTVPAPVKTPERIVMQPEIRAWLDESGITDWSLRWVDVSDPKDLKYDEGDSRNRHTLDTALVFHNPREAVLFKLAMAGRVKGRPKPTPSNIAVIRNLSV